MSVVANATAGVAPNRRCLVLCPRPSDVENVVAVEAALSVASISLLHRLHQHHHHIRLSIVDRHPTQRGAEWTCATTRRCGSKSGIVLCPWRVVVVVVKPSLMNLLSFLHPSACRRGGVRTVGYGVSRHCGLVVAECEQAT
jgi:hypothetical protein